MYREMMDTIGLVNTVDPELGAAMNRELTRQRQNIELIASENIVSPAVMAAMGSVLTASCSVPSTPTSSPIPVHRPIWPSTSPCWIWAIPSWAWICPRAAI